MNEKEARRIHKDRPQSVYGHPYRDYFKASGYLEAIRKAAGLVAVVTRVCDTRDADYGHDSNIHPEIVGLRDELIKYEAER